MAECPSPATNVSLALMSNVNAQDAAEVPSVEQQRPRKRKRRACGKTFCCPNEGCGRAYSRAEHLHRHQLNHAPKEIFYCDFNGCSLSFVRRDLCERHKRRHLSKAPQLQHSTPPESELDPLLILTPSEDAQPNSHVSKSASSMADQDSTSVDFHQARDISNTFVDDPSTSLPLNQSAIPPESNISTICETQMECSGGFNQDLGHAMQQAQDLGPENGSHSLEHHVPIGNTDSTSFRMSHGARSVSKNNRPALTDEDLFSTQVPQWNNSNKSVYVDPMLPPAASKQYLAVDPSYMLTDSSQASFRASQTLQPGLPPGPNSVPARKASDQELVFAHHDYQSHSQPTSFESLPTTAAIPTSQDYLSFSASNFEEQDFEISPATVTDDFVTWFFQENASNRMQSTDSALNSTYYANDFGLVRPDHFADLPSDRVHLDLTEEPVSFSAAGVSEILGCQMQLSSRRRQSLLNLMKWRFVGDGQSAIDEHNIKYKVLGGDMDAEGHALSLQSMQLYLDSYWQSFDGQLPILHKPTFSVDYVHDYLLLAVMCMGASLLNRKVNGLVGIAAATQFANFVARNLRWQIFMDPASRPPAKLWVFQSLLILEQYEKLNSTRELHERAHIHFGTTLTLMRRGSALVGESKISTPQRGSLDFRQPNWRNQSENAEKTPDEWWSLWIAEEATRRAAFAALLLDTTHATMFGHRATMNIEDIHLPLPCDDILWSATSSSEVGRIEASLRANGVKPTTFLEGLKKILSRRKVWTGSFGRIILMAGLLSITWHVQRRDLYDLLPGKQVPEASSERRKQLSRVCEWWMKDYNDSLAHIRRSAVDWQRYGSGQTDGETSEGLGKILHHLSHIAVNVSITDCCIYAGANRLIGREVSIGDYKKVKEKMLIWAATEGARDAVCHALKFLTHIFQPRNAEGRASNMDHNAWRVSAGNENHDDTLLHGYSAGDDVLLYRPWLVYFSALTIWSYGFALDGPLRPFPAHLQYPSPRSSAMTFVMQRSNGGGEFLAPQEDAELISARRADAEAFLRSTADVHSPADVERVHAGRNKVVGLLSMVDAAFEGSRWELLHEARQRLRGAADQLRTGGRDF